MACSQAFGPRQLDNTASAVIRSGINGTDLRDELQQGIVTAFLNTGAAQGASGFRCSAPRPNHRGSAREVRFTPHQRAMNTASTAVVCITLSIDTHSSMPWMLAPPEGP